MSLRWKRDQCLYLHNIHSLLGVSGMHKCDLGDLDRHRGLEEYHSECLDVREAWKQLDQYCAGQSMARLEPDLRAGYNLEISKTC